MYIYIYTYTDTHRYILTYIHTYIHSERDVENSNTINQQKRKLARLQDNLSSLMSKYSKTDKQYKQQNMDLTEEYKRITEQFQDLQVGLLCVFVCVCRCAGVGVFGCMRVIKQ